MADASAAVRADMSKFNRDLQEGGDQAVRGLGDKIKGVFSPKNLAIAGVAGGVAIAGAITAGLADAVGALLHIERLNAQTDAAIRSTGGAAKVTREEVSEMAGSLEKLTGIEQESIQEGQNLLLTFTNIRNEAGEGNDIFTRATEAMVDYGVAMGTDAKGGAIQLGKALNDPIKGMTALGRAGVQFTEEQREMIEGFVESGDLLSAQKVILEELETQFGGSAEAFGNTTSGKIAKFQNSVGDMFESIVLGAAKVADAVGDVTDIMAMHFGDMGDRANALAENTGRSFNDIKQMVIDRMELTGEGVDAALLAIERRFNQSGEEITTSATEGWAATARAFAESEQPIRDAAAEIADIPVEEIEARYEAIQAAGHQVVLEFAAGMLTPQTDVETAIQAALKVVEDEMSVTEELAYLSGQRTVLENARGIAEQEGKDASVLAIDAALQVVEDRMSELADKAYDYGFNIPSELARGMTAGKGLVVDPARQIAQNAARPITIESEPPDRSSPLYGITKWGGNIVRTLADGILGELGVGRSASVALAAALAPTFAGAMPLAGGASGAGMGGGNTYQLIVNGVERTFNSRDDFMNALADLSRFGDGGLSG